MKKVVSVLLALALVAASVFALAGCSKKGVKSYDLVLITDGAPVNDKGYNQSAWNGVKAYGDENNMTYRYYQPKTDEKGELSTETVKNYIDLAVNDGAKYVVLPGEAFAVSAYEIAPTYSDVQFLLVDAYPHSQDDDTLRIQSNVMSISFDTLQAGFLAGYSSVVDGYTKLGYLGSVNSKSSDNYGAGFAQGAAFAADELSVPVKLDFAEYDADDLDYDYSFTIRPVYIPVSEAKEDTFKVNVEGGMGTGVYTDGENVTITASPAPSGKVFDHWDVKSDTEGVRDNKVNISSKKDTKINLLVGDCDCTITAVWADAVTHSVTITEADGVTAHEILNITENTFYGVNAPAASSGLVFDHWETADDSVLKDVNSSSTDVYVSDSDITLVPVYAKSEAPTFDVTVENGTGTGSYSVGDYINTVADAPKDGYMFYKWENIDNQGLSTGIAMENEYCYTTDFEMVDRFASIVEKMYDDGTEVVFGGGNPLSDSIFTATDAFDYNVYAFGSGIDESSKGNCLASVVNDYGAAIKLALADYQGGSIFTADCSNECIYVTGKNLVQFQLDEDGNPVQDEDGNEIENSDFNQNYATIYSALADGLLKPSYLKAGGDIKDIVKSACLTLNYWITED